VEGRQQTQTDVTGDQSRFSSPYVMSRSQGRGEKFEESGGSESGVKS